MRVLVTGTTGFVGVEALQQCLDDPHISSVIALSRRNLDEAVTKNPKMAVVLHEDFASYPDDFFKNMGDVRACIWCLGGKVQDLGSVEAARRVEVDFTKAAAKELEMQVASRMHGQERFRFVYCSGMGAELVQEKQLWIFGDTRKLKGLAETGLAEVEEKSSNFEAIIFRPGGILPNDSVVARRLLPLVVPVLYVSELVQAMVEAALGGSSKKLLQNDDIVELARKANAAPANLETREAAQ